MLSSLRIARSLDAVSYRAVGAKSLLLNYNMFLKMVLYDRDFPKPEEIDWEEIYNGWYRNDPSPDLEKQIDSAGTYAEETFNVINKLNEQLNTSSDQKKRAEIVNEICNYMAAKFTFFKSALEAGLALDLESIMLSTDNKSFLSILKNNGVVRDVPLTQ
tara:strand:+ start:142 stop:618 length:477 start_codon:yes stop_codon:yes gene_type:complete